MLLLSTAAQAQTYVPGQSYFGRANYIEYIAGNMPVIITAPHGGSLKPAELPDRSVGTLVADANTEDMARKIQTAFGNHFGALPHVVICRLHRSKIDCNREIVEGAGGDALTEISWHDFQDFITLARQKVTTQFARGLVLDMHGHGHTLQRLELGYLLTASQLDHSDAVLNAGNYGQYTGIRDLDARSALTFAQLLRGTGSLGDLLSAHGYPSVPSPAIPSPGTDPYFDGGYNTAQHGSRDGGTISAVQIECNFTGVRDTSVNRSAFATELAAVVDSYLADQFTLVINPNLPYSSWQQTRFGTDWTDSVLAGESSDPDHDGIVNLIEYALSGDPKISDAAILPNVKVQASKIAVIFSRAVANTDLAITVQGSDSPGGSWVDLASSVNGSPMTSIVGGATVLETGTGATRNVTVSDVYTLNNPAHPRRFFRLQVTRM